MADRVTQVAVEVLDQSSVPNVRATQVAVEVLETTDSSLVNARVTQVAVEVLAQVVTTPQPMTIVGMVG